MLSGVPVCSIKAAVTTSSPSKENFRFLVPMTPLMQEPCRTRYKTRRRNKTKKSVWIYTQSKAHTHTNTHAYHRISMVNSPSARQYAVLQEC